MPVPPIKCRLNAVAKEKICEPISEDANENRKIVPKAKLLGGKPLVSAPTERRYERVEFTVALMQIAEPKA